MTELTLAIMRRMWPRGNERVPGLVEGIVATAPAVFKKYGINSDLLVAHAMGQFSEECGAGHDVQENMNYTAERIRQVWPSRPEAVQYAHDPRALANSVYGHRMGNRPGTDDGFNFRGQGGSQLTGRDNYVALKARTGLDVVDHPEILVDPQHFLECAVADWIMCGCLPFALRDDIVGETKKLNGGLIGIGDRQTWIANWKRVLANPPVGSAEKPPGAHVSRPAPAQPTPKTLLPVAPRPQPAAQGGWMAALGRAINAFFAPNK